MMKKPAKPMKKPAAKMPMKPTKPMKKAMKGAMYALPFALLCLGSGCAMLYNKTPILSTGADGTTVVANATTMKFGFGTKDATGIGSLALSADAGLSFSGYDSKTDSSMALIKAIELGAQLGGAYMRAQGIPAGQITTTPVEQNSEPVVTP